MLPIGAAAYDISHALPHGRRERDDLTASAIGARGVEGPQLVGGTKVDASSTDQTRMADGLAPINNKEATAGNWSDKEVLRIRGLGIGDESRECVVRIFTKEISSCVVQEEPSTEFVHQDDSQL